MFWKYIRMIWFLHRSLGQRPWPWLMSCHIFPLYFSDSMSWITSPTEMLDAMFSGDSFADFSLQRMNIVGVGIFCSVCGSVNIN